MQRESLAGAFANPPIDSANAFRRILDAMARPGMISQIAGATAPSPVSSATAATILTLCDASTRIYLAPSVDVSPVRDWIAFHTGAQCGPTDEADFAIGTWAELSDTGPFAVGTDQYPDRSVTWIVQMEKLKNAGAVLRGPGIKDSRQLNLPRSDFYRKNAALFPLGIDLIFTSRASIAAVPRTTRVEEAA